MNKNTKAAIGLELLAKLADWKTRKNSLIDLMDSAVAENDYLQAALHQRDLDMLDKCISEIRNILMRHRGE